MVVRVVTWNIQHGRRPDGAVDVDALCAACASFEADVLALQEVDRVVPRSGEVDEIARIGEATGMHWSFGEAMPGYGNGLLARRPLDDVEVLALPHRPTREPRCAVLARVDGLSLAATHLGLFGDADRQLPVVEAALRRQPAPRVLLGDLNMEEPVLDGFVTSRPGPTYPSHAPRLQIDHVALSGVGATRSMVLPQQPVSDHRPLLVEFG